MIGRSQKGRRGWRRTCFPIIPMQAIEGTAAMVGRGDIKHLPGGRAWTAETLEMALQ